MTKNMDIRINFDKDEISCDDRQYCSVFTSVAPDIKVKFSKVLIS